MIAGRVLEAGEERMSPVCARIVLEPQIRVPHRARRARPERDTEQVGQPEVFAPDTPLVAERCLVSRHEAAASIDEGAKLLALLDPRERRCWAGSAS